MSLHHRQRGFSLVELLVAIGISSILGVMLFAGFRSSMRLWQNIENRVSVDYGWIRFSREFASDVRKSVELSKVSRHSVVLRQVSQYVKWKADSSASVLTLTRMTSASSDSFSRQPGDVVIRLPYIDRPLALRFSSPGTRTVQATLQNGYATFTLRESFRNAN